MLTWLYYLKYAQAYNEQRVFVRDPKTGQFLLAKDFDENLPPEPTQRQSDRSGKERISSRSERDDARSRFRFSSADAHAAAFDASGR